MAFGATGVFADVVESTDPATLRSKIAASFAAQLVAAPVSQLIEVSLAGGGAGGVLQATIYYSTDEDGVFPNLADQHVFICWGSDRKTIFGKLADFYATTPVDRTTFVEKVAQGAGIQWVDLVIYTRLLTLDAPVREAGITRPGGLPVTSIASNLAARAQVRRRSRKG